MTEHGPLRIESFTEPVFGENGLLLWIDGQPDGWLIDPGLPPQHEQMLHAVKQLDLARLAVVLTHAHADHIAGIEPLRAALHELPIICPEDEADLLTNADANLSASFGLPITAPPADQLVKPGENLQLADLTWQVLDAAGHSPGGVAYYCAEVAVALVGDAVFAEGIGRYDFPHSDRERLLRNIEENLLSLPDQTAIYPGHGPPSTIGQIKVANMTLMSEMSR